MNSKENIRNDYLYTIFAYNIIGDMMSKESFILFARNHPELAKEVVGGNTSWQQLYELFEIYGENHSVWNQFLKKDFDLNSFKDLYQMIKNIDLDGVQTGIANIQKTVNLLQDIGIGKQQSEPIYKRFL